MSCGDMVGDNRFETIAKAKRAILDGTNIETDEDEMKVLDNILFRCWQMGWLDKYDDTKNQTRWTPCSERLPSKEDCPMDCLVTRKSNFIGNYVDMAVAEANGTWTHEDWDAIVLGDVESGRKTGLISTRDDGIIAWMPLPTPYKGGEE